VKAEEKADGEAHDEENRQRKEKPGHVVGRDMPVEPKEECDVERGGSEDGVEGQDQDMTYRAADVQDPEGPVQ